MLATVNTLLEDPNPKSGVRSSAKVRITFACIYFPLVLWRVFGYTIKPAAWVMTYPEYLADLDRSGGGREISNMQPWITLQNQGGGWSVDIVKISVSQEDFFNIQAI